MGVDATKMEYLTYRDLHQFFCGQAITDLETLKSLVNFNSVPDEHQKWFWEILSEMSPKEWKSLLIFWIGATHLPYDFIASRYRIYVAYDSYHSPLPTAGVCGRTITVAKYSSKADFKKNLLLALEWGAFGYYDESPPDWGYGSWY